MLRIRIRQNKEWDRDFTPYEAVFGLEGEAGGQKEQLLEQALSGDLTWTGERLAGLGVFGRKGDPLNGKGDTPVHVGNPAQSPFM